MILKRIIAREWLYLLAFVVFTALLATIVYFGFSPEEVPYASATDPSESYNEEEVNLYLDSIEVKLLELYRQKINVLRRHGSGVDGLIRKAQNSKELEETKLKRDSLFAIARKNWTMRRAEWVVYSDRTHLIQGLTVLAIFLPYPLFLFVRSILWAIRQVKKKST